MTATQPAGGVQLPAPGAYQVEPTRSKVRYTGRHMFNLGGVEASLAVTDGVIHVAEPATSSSVELTLDPASWKSDSAQRDKVVKGKLLRVDRYPTITFRSTTVAQDGERWQVDGEGTAHGETRPVRVTVDSASVDGATLTVHAVTELDRYEFGVTGAKGFAGRRLTLDFDLVATLIPPGL